MKIVGLLSGGKDSCFNLCHCVAQGHQVVCLASLAPPKGTDELDSYMYQTVGQDAIETVAQAMQLPLYRRIITGKALVQTMQYGSEGATNGDETEDLYELLQNVLREHPDVRGVSVGAILSNYQRIRVEDVCARRGLTSLAYLWQRDQNELLDEMAQAGLVSVLIKVAGAGLRTRHLGQSVTSSPMREELRRLHAKYELHPCGEGGEYETFTLDCSLFKQRIELTETELVLSSASEDEFSTVAHLRIKRARLVDKSPGIETLTVPPLLDEYHLELLRPSGGSSMPLPSSMRDAMQSAFAPPPADTKTWRVLCDLTSPCEGVTAQARDCLQRLAAQANEHIVRLVHLDVHLADMTDFASMNAVYRDFFRHSPPTRACIALDLPGSCRIRITGVGVPAAATVEILHVQSLSYWAPANIGPYAQAVACGSQLFVAGAIGMRPADLSIAESSAASEAIDASRLGAVLASQHVERIVAAASTRPKRIQSCICWLNGTSVDGIESSIYRRGMHQWQSSVTACLFLVAAGLPKDACVEYQTTWHLMSASSEDSDGTDLGSHCGLYAYETLPHTPPEIHGSDWTRVYHTAKAKPTDAWLHKLGGNEVSVIEVRGIATFVSQCFSECELVVMPIQFSSV